MAPRVWKTGESKVGAVCSLGLIDLWVSGGQVEYRKDPNRAAQGRKLRFQSSVPPVVAMQLFHWATLTPYFAPPAEHVHIEEPTRRVVPLWGSLPPASK